MTVDDRGQTLSEEVAAWPLNTDRILVIDRNEVVEEGRHHELGARCDVYSRLRHSHSQSRPDADKRSVV